MTGKPGAAWACPGPPLPQDAPPPQLPRPLPVALEHGPGSADQAGGEPGRLGKAGAGAFRPVPPQGQAQLQVTSPGSPVPPTPDRAAAPGRPGGPQHPGSPSTDHSFPGTSRERRHLLPSRAGVCKLLGEGAPPREQPGTRVEKRKREGGKKVRKKRKREGESARSSTGRAARSAAGERRGRRGRKAAGPRGPGPCACARSRPPPRASGRCAGAPGVRVPAAGGCPARDRRAPHVGAAAAAARGRRRGRGVYLPPRPSSWAGLRRASQGRRP